jgi:hypothetical protein
MKITILFQKFSARSPTGKSVSTHHHNFANSAFLVRNLSFQAGYFNYRSGKYDFIGAKFHFPGEKIELSGLLF